MLLWVLGLKKVSMWLALQFITLCQFPMSVIGLSPNSWIWKGKWRGKLKEKVEQIALELYIYSLYSDWQTEDFSQTKSKVSEKPECWGKKKRI